MIIILFRRDEANAKLTEMTTSMIAKLEKEAFNL